MKQLKIVLILFFMIGISAPTQAQFWKKLKKKVQQKVENKIDKETDKVIDKTLDGDPSKKKNQEKPSADVPKFKGGKGVLKLYNYGFEYVVGDEGISVYGKFNTKNLASAVKTYNEEKVIKPVDAFPIGYALAYSKSGYLNPQGGKIDIHHADSTKVVFSLSGTWNTIDGNKPVTASYVSFDVGTILDKRQSFSNTISNSNNTNTTSNNNSTTNNPYVNNNNSTSVNIPNTFSFSSSLEVKMTSSNGTTADLEFLLGNYSNIYAMAIASKEMGAGGKVYNVVTPKSITMFMNVAGMKMKKTVPQQQFSQSNFSDKIPTNSEELKKTGNSKNILGFTCYEYKYVNDGGYISLWATQDFPGNSASITMLGMREGGPVKGFVLEIDSKSGNDKVNMKAVKYNRNKNVTINTKEYKSMGF